MAHFEPNDIASAVAKDLPAFPTTHMRDDLAFDEPAFRAYADLEEPIAEHGDVAPGTARG